MQDVRGTGLLRRSSRLLQRESRTLAWLGLIFGSIALAILGASLLLDAGQIVAGMPWRTLGLPVPAACPGCPLCGMTRAFCALGHGQLLVAWALNPLSWLLYPLGWLAGVIWLPASLHTLIIGSRPWPNLLRPR
jgi:hypothetical protein